MVHKLLAQLLAHNPYTILAEYETLPDKVRLTLISIFIYKSKILLILSILILIPNIQTCK